MGPGPYVRPNSQVFRLCPGGHVGTQVRGQAGSVGGVVGTGGQAAASQSLHLAIPAAAPRPAGVGWREGMWLPEGPAPDQATVWVSGRCDLRSSRSCVCRLSTEPGGRLLVVPQACRCPHHTVRQTNDVFLSPPPLPPPHLHTTHGHRRPGTLRTQARQGDFVCVECGTRFHQPGHLRAHTRAHTGTPPATGPGPPADPGGALGRGAASALAVSPATGT